MPNIAIVGAGIAGLHLGLFLRKHQIPVTLFAEQTPEQIRAARLPNTVAISPRTRAREREIDINHWDQSSKGLYGVDLFAAGAPPLSFRADFAEPWLAVDMRIYLSRLLEDFTLRGGQVHTGSVTAAELGELARRFDLVVVASGKAGLTQLFPRIESRSPYLQAQRVLCAGFFKGISIPARPTLSFNISPGHGEVFCGTFHSFDGDVSNLLFEGIPGQAFQVLSELKYDEDPRRFDQTVLELLRVHVPAVYARVDREAFGLVRSLDLLQGSVTPVVRRGFADLGDGKHVIAIGDAHVTNDPITGQGANLASQAAWATGRAILSATDLDERFCRKLEHHLWDLARPATEWSNFMLRPPEPHVFELMGAAAASKSVANAFANGFNAPEEQWRVISTAEATRAFIQQLMQPRLDASALGEQLLS
jgi:hypothetical protein